MSQYMPVSTSEFSVLSPWVLGLQMIIPWLPFLWHVAHLVASVGNFIIWSTLEQRESISNWQQWIFQYTEQNRLNESDEERDVLK